VPRNIVTVMPRRFALPTRRNRETDRKVRERLARRYRPRPRADGGIEIDFPKRVGRRAAKDEVLAELERVDPRWARVFVVHPRESSLRG
jgi:hypothetical protein